MNAATQQIVQRMQGMLESVYEIEAGYRATDFLITNAALARSLQAAAEAPPEEQLLVVQGGDDALISLYLEEALLERLAARDPWRTLSGENLADYCLALEGVSHFVYLAWNARHDRPVTRRDLELQAEVDKFVTALVLLARQHGSAPGAALHDSLFRRVRFRATLDDEGRALYREVNELAARYCADLLRGHRQPALRQGLWRNLRRFYRLAHHQKLAHIRGTAVH